MNKIYLQTDYATGLFFEYSATEKEGYDKHTSSKERVSYRKYYYKGIEGKLKGVYLFEGKFGNEIKLTVENKENLYYISVSLADQKGNVDNTYAEHLIALLPALKLESTYTFRAYNFIPENEKYAKTGFNIKENGEKLAKLTHAYKSKTGEEVAGDIPKLVFKADALGKIKPTAVSVEAKNDYLLGVLTAQISRFKGDVPKQELKQEKSEDPLKNINSDDLPF